MLAERFGVCCVYLRLGGLYDLLYQATPYHQPRYQTATPTG